MNQDDKFATNPSATDPTFGPSKQGRSFASLLGDLMRETRMLLQNELRLARAETHEMLDVIRRNLAAIAIGVGFGLGSMLALTMAFTGALVELFDEFMSENVYVWLAPLMVAIVFGLVAYALVRKGAEAIRRQGLYPQKTVETLKEDTEWLRRRVS